MLEVGNDIDEDLAPMPPTDINMIDDLNDVMVSIPNSLPVPITINPVLAGPCKKEKQRRITNQDVLKLQAEVLQYQKEMLLIKKQKLELQVRAVQG